MALTWANKFGLHNLFELREIIGIFEASNFIIREKLGLASTYSILGEQKYYRCFFLRAYGFSSERIAQLVGIHKASVPVYISNGRKALRAIIALLEQA